MKFRIHTLQMGTMSIHSAQSFRLYWATSPSLDFQINFFPEPKTLNSRLHYVIIDLIHIFLGKQSEELKWSEIGNTATRGRAVMTCRVKHKSVTQISNETSQGLRVDFIWSEASEVALSTRSKCLNAADQGIPTSQIMSWQTWRKLPDNVLHVCDDLI